MTVKLRPLTFGLPIIKYGVVDKKCIICLPATCLPACCDFFNSNVDDSGYLRDLIEIIQANYNIDEFSIHFTGISNGGFMSYRMACEHADLIASIAPLAGTTFIDPSDCSPSEPVHVLHLHGTADSTIDFDGGCILFSC